MDTKQIVSLRKPKIEDFVSTNYAFLNTHIEKRPENCFLRFCAFFWFVSTPPGQNICEQCLPTLKAKFYHILTE